MNRPFIGSLLLVIALGACNSSSGQVQVTKAKTDTIRPGASVALAVNAAEASGNAEDVKRSVQNVQDNLYLTLPASGLFSQVVAEGEAADYAMDVDITNVHLVSGTPHVIGGAFSGANMVSADVVLTDASNGLEVTEFSATGESTSNPFSSVGGFNSAVREFSDQVTQALQQ